MNANLLEAAKKLCSFYDPNEMAFAIATTYNEMSRRDDVSDANAKICKKIATQYSRVNGHFFVVNKIWHYDTNETTITPMPGNMPPEAEPVFP